jgi:hypothetical protein
MWGLRRSKLKFINSLLEVWKMKALNFVCVLLAVVLVSSAGAAPLITNGLVEYWGFDETGGLTVNGYNGNNGTLNTAGGMTWTGAGGGFDGVGGALSFGAANIYESVQMPVGTIAGIGDAVSVAYWMNGADDMSLRNYIVAAYGPSWNLVAQNPDNLYGLQHVWQAGTNLMSIPATDESTYKNQWNHWAMTIDVSTGEMNMYLNGDLMLGITNATAALNFAGNYLFTVGNHPYGGAAYKGLLDEMYIFDRALDAAEVSALAVPEPATLVLLGLGGLLSLRKKKN